LYGTKPKMELQLVGKKPTRNVMFRQKVSGGSDITPAKDLMGWPNTTSGRVARHRDSSPSVFLFPSLCPSLCPFHLYLLVSQCTGIGLVRHGAAMNFDGEFSGLVTLRPLRELEAQSPLPHLSVFHHRLPLLSTTKRPVGQKTMGCDYSGASTQKDKADQMN
jgi:hypothetical protein